MAAGILGMQACLLLFGWVLTAFATVMLVAVGLLLRAQLRHDRGRAATGPGGPRERGRTRQRLTAPHLIHREGGPGDPAVT